MKIAFITNRYYPAVGGSEAFTQVLAEELVNRGNEVTIYCSDFIDWFGYKKIGDSGNLVNGVTVHRLPSFRLFGKDALTIISPLFSLGNELQQYDIVHTFAYGYSASWIPAMLKSKKKFTKPIVFSPQYNDNPSYGRFISKFYDLSLGKLTLNAADSIVLETNAFLAKFDEKKVTVIPSIVKPIPALSQEMQQELRTTLGIPSDAKIFLSLSRVSKQKGIGNLIVGFAEFLKKYNGFLIIAGDGDYLRQAKELTNSFGISKRVIFTGEVHGIAKELLFTIADGFVSLSTSESFGLTIIEAMSSRLPILALNIPTYHALLSEFTNAAILIDSSTPHSVGNALETLLSKPKIDYPIIKDFTIPNVVDKYVSLYKSQIQS